MTQDIEQGAFADYRNDGKGGATWITLATGEYYPDILPLACTLYLPVLAMFGQLIEQSESSTRLFKLITEQPQSWMRIQLSRVFRKYVSPATPVEMLKRKIATDEIIANFGKQFRPIREVQTAFKSRPMPDEALCALLWEYKDRGKRGYDLTERFFEIIETHYPQVTIEGPKRAGADILMGEVFADYPTQNKPIDFVIRDRKTKSVLAIGLAHYDSDRGGGQEDDRTGQYASTIDELAAYTKSHELDAKIILLNDGPGLLLGSMWNDYAKLETRHSNRVLVVTLRMLNERLTMGWLTGKVK